MGPASPCLGKHLCRVLHTLWVALESKRASKPIAQGTALGGPPPTAQTEAGALWLEGQRGSCRVNWYGNI